MNRAHGALRGAHTVHVFWTCADNIIFFTCMDCHWPVGIRKSVMVDKHGP